MLCSFPVLRERNRERVRERERGREGGREEGREGGREGRRKGGMEGGREERMGWGGGYKVLRSRPPGSPTGAGAIFLLFLLARDLGVVAVEPVIFCAFCLCLYTNFRVYICAYIYLYIYIH